VFTLVGSHATKDEKKRKPSAKLTSQANIEAKCSFLLLIYLKIQPCFKKKQ
jgi:hypothetical protein